jgi:hypothetical protein
LKATKAYFSPEGERELVALRETTGWSQTKTIERAVRALFILHAIRDAQAREAGGEAGRLLRRVTVEFGAAELVNKKIEWGLEVDDRPAISATDAEGRVVFYEDGNRLMALRERAGHVEHFAVREGALALEAVHPPTAPDLN